MGDDVASQNPGGIDGDRIQSKGGFPDRFRGCVIDERSGSGSLGMGGNACGFLDGHTHQVGKLSPAKEFGAPRLVGFVEVGDLPHLGSSGSVNHQADFAVIGSAVINQNLTDISNRIDVGGEWIGSSGPGGAARSLVGNGANVGLNGVAEFPHGLSQHVVDDRLPANGIIQLPEGFPDQRNSDVGDLAESEGISRNRLIVPCWNGHCWRVAGVQRWLSGAEAGDGPVDGDAFNAAIDDDGLQESGRFARYPVTGAKEIFHKG